MRRAIETTVETWAVKDFSRPLLIRGARRVGKTHVAETVGRRIAGDAFVKLDFQTDLKLIEPLFDGPTDDVDGIMARIADYKRMPVEKESSLVRVGASVRQEASSALQHASAGSPSPAESAKKPCIP